MSIDEPIFSPEELEALAKEQKGLEEFRRKRESKPEVRQLVDDLERLMAERGWTRAQLLEYLQPVIREISLRAMKDIE